MAHDNIQLCPYNKFEECKYNKCPFYRIDHLYVDSDTHRTMTAHRCDRAINETRYIRDYKGGVL